MCRPALLQALEGSGLASTNRHVLPSRVDPGSEVLYGMATSPATSSRRFWSGMLAVYSIHKPARFTISGRPRTQGRKFSTEWRPALLQALEGSGQASTNRHVLPSRVDLGAEVLYGMATSLATSSRRFWSGMQAVYSIHKPARFTISALLQALEGSGQASTNRHVLPSRVDLGAEVLYGMATSPATSSRRLWSGMLAIHSIHKPARFTISGRPRGGSSLRNGEQKDGKTVAKTHVRTKHNFCSLEPRAAKIPVEHGIADQDAEIKYRNRTQDVNTRFGIVARQSSAENRRKKKSKDNATNPLAGKLYHSQPARSIRLDSLQLMNGGGALRTIAKNGPDTRGLQDLRREGQLVQCAKVRPQTVTSAASGARSDRGRTCSVFPVQPNSALVQLCSRSQMSPLAARAMLTALRFLRPLQEKRVMSGVQDLPSRQQTLCSDSSCVKLEATPPSLPPSPVAASPSC
ncbi:hypothetical protein RRG08_062697 [Elysia crispata]|uniref:Uncharacterized protein n=1 Tax=Elysia crispata TaxID=231223 RepID=A0AAE1DW60_9GAST|nr:hypothetical protein RRG08_062697 [Elysia crispata]